MTEPITEFQGPNRFLSNFWMHPVWHTIERWETKHQMAWALVMLFPSNEHAYQASKTLNLTWIAQICGQTTAGGAKKAGRESPLRDDWEEIKVQTMLEIVRVKFSGPTIGKWLLDTGDAELIEGNTWGDDFWGVCYGEGENHLGKILMQVRKELEHGRHDKPV